MPLVTTAVTISTVRQQIADHLRRAILTGALKPGERIVERDVAAQLQTSLTAVREAIIQLEGEGFISKRPNASTFVTRMDAGDIAKIFLVRQALEGLAFDQAARLATDTQAAALSELHRKAVEAAQAGQPQTYLEHDLAWHQTVWAASANEYLASALRKLVLPLFGFTAIRMAAVGVFDLVEDAESHAELTEAVRARDPEWAARAYATAIARWASITFADVQALGASPARR